MTDKPTEALERAEELVFSQARLSFDPSRVAIRRDDLRVLVRLANAMHQASDARVADALESARQRATVLFQSYVGPFCRDEAQFMRVVEAFGEELAEALKSPISHRLQAKAHEGEG
jgi:hypothetical protein